MCLQLNLAINLAMHQENFPKEVPLGKVLILLARMNSI